MTAKTTGSSGPVACPTCTSRPRTRAARRPSTARRSPGASETTRARPLSRTVTGHVIGHFIRGLPVAGHARHLPYAYVDSVDETLDKVTANGGTIIRPPFPEGDLWVATVEDPAGNLLGIWQRGPSERGYLLTTIDERRC